MTDHLQTGFDYDLWANKAWVACLDRFPKRDRAEDVLRHIIFAHRVWMARIYEVLGEGKETDDLTGLGLDQAFARSAQEWKELVKSIGPDRQLMLDRKGESQPFTLEQVARHLINHGTYHRGELRGIAWAEGFEDFPETDFSRYVREELS